MADILLIQPPIQDFYLTAKRTMPYGLAGIAALLEHAGFSVEILDCLATAKQKIIPWPPEMSYLKDYYGRSDRSPFALFHHFRHFGYSFEHIGRIAKESGAFLVGISSLFTAYADMAILTARAVKKALPECCVVIGGHHPTTMPEVVMRHPEVDFVLRGEGEVSMPLLARSVKRKEPVCGIPGIVYRKKNGLLTVSPPAMIENPDLLPLPATHLLKNDYYKRAKRGSMVVVTSRGCPMTCSYCAMARTPYRQRALDAVLKEMERAIERYDVRFFDFEDENISLNRKWFAAFLDAATERFESCGLELRAMNGLMPSTLDETIISKMAKAGFKTLNLSLGSQDGNQLRRFRRPDVRRDFENAVISAGKHGLETVGYVIAGAPGQAPRISVQDILYLTKMDVLAGISTFYPAPGSRDYQTAQESGMLPEKFSLMRSSALPISNTTTRTDAATLLRLSRIANFIKGMREPGSSSRTSRTQLGENLLFSFFKDGKILGKDNEGNCYIHKTSKHLVRMFMEGL